MPCFEEHQSDWERLNVSRETFLTINSFIELLLERQKRDNLFSRSEVQDIWVRHVIDSAQLSLYIKKEARTLMDFGSGNGFPGIILGIMRPELKIALVEKSKKKAEFLENVIKKLQLTAEVYNVPFSLLKVGPSEVLTARALAPLPRLLENLRPFVNSKSLLILPKGRRWEEEIGEARKRWSFSFQAQRSLTSDESRILLIRNLVKR